MDAPYSFCQFYIYLVSVPVVMKSVFVSLGICFLTSFDLVWSFKVDNN